MAHQSVQWQEYPSTVGEDVTHLLTLWANSGTHPFETLTSSGAEASYIRNTSATGAALTNTIPVVKGEIYRLDADVVIINDGGGVIQFFQFKTGLAAEDLTASATPAGISSSQHFSIDIEITRTCDAGLFVTTTASPAIFKIYNIRLQKLTNLNSKEYRNSIVCHPIIDGLSYSGTGAGDTLSTLCITDPFPSSWQGQFEYTFTLNEHMNAIKNGGGVGDEIVLMMVQPIYSAPISDDNTTEADKKTLIDTWFHAIDGTLAQWGVSNLNPRDPDNWEIKTNIIGAHPTYTPEGNIFGWAKDSGVWPFQAFSDGSITVKGATGANHQTRLLVYFTRQNGSTDTVERFPVSLRVTKNIQSNKIR